MSTTGSPGATSTAVSPSASSGGIPQLPPSFKIIGIILAIASGVLIGSSFVFKKKGLLQSQAGGEAGQGVAYLKSFMWWTGMIMMILGEFCNFAAYAFVPAVVVTPLGALSVVICAILSSFFLNEKLTFFGWIGCGLCIVGSVVIALNAPQEQSVGQIEEFKKLFLAPGFLVWGGILIIASITIAVYFIPRYGKKSMLWCIFVCSMIGGLSVSTTTGLGGAIVTSIFLHENQFKNVFIYFLLAFVAVTLITEVYYLNMALAMFNTAMVTPTYYVIFTAFTLITTVVLFQGLKSTAIQIITVVMGFLVICAGIVILQMSKVDPTKLKGLDRRSTMLLQASRNVTENTEKSITGYEDPGMDTLRGTFGTVGSIIRARTLRRMSQSSHGTALSTRGIQRHQLYDPPVPGRTDSIISGTGSDGRPEQISMYSGPPRTPTVKFEAENVAHYYRGPGESGEARHERLAARGEPSSTRQPSPSPSKQGNLAPPTLTIGRGSDGLPLSAPPNERAFYSPPRQDPFEGSPSTSTGAGFLDIPYNEETPRGSRKLSSGKRYPKAGATEDREESMSLVGNPLDRKENEDGESETDTDLEAPREPGIRLLSSSTRI